MSAVNTKAEKIKIQSSNEQFLKNTILYYVRLNCSREMEWKQQSRRKNAIIIRG